MAARNGKSMGDLWSIQPQVLNDLAVSGVILAFVRTSSGMRLSLYIDRDCSIVNNRDFNFAMDGSETGRGSMIGEVQ